MYKAEPSVFDISYVLRIEHKLAFGYSKNAELDLAPEKDGRGPKLDEILIAEPRQQLLLLSRAQQSIQNAHY